MNYVIFNQSDAESIGSEADIILQFSGEKYFLADSPFGYRGLYIKLSYNNRGSRGDSLKRQWYYRYSLGKRQRKHPMGDLRMMDYKEACRKHAELAERVKEGEDIVATFKAARAEAAAKPETVSFEKVAMEWLASKESSIKTYTYYQVSNRLHKHILPFFKGMTCDTITYDDVVQLRNKVYAQTPAMSTPVLSYMRQILTYAAENRYCAGNVAMEVVVKHKQRKRSAWFQDTDIVRIFKSLERDDIPVSVMRCVKLLALTGLRRQNVIALRKSEVLMLDTGGAVINLDGSVMKQGIAFKVFVDQETVEKVIQPAILESGDSDYVFPAARRGGSGYISPVNVSQYMKIVLDSLEIEGCLHSWRASFLSGAMELGLDGRIADQCLAHTPAGTIGIYKKSWEYPAMCRVWSAWQRHVWNIVEFRSEVVSDDDKVRQLFQ